MIAITTTDFISKAKKIHGDRYIYDGVNYTKAIVKVEIICLEHGKFLQTPNSHLNGHGCKKCAQIETGIHFALGKQEFIKRAEAIHGKKYIYTKSVYVNSNTPLEIICPEHGSFYQRPINHYKQKDGCPKCANVLNGVNKRKTLEDFIKGSQKVHGSLYDYSLSEYTTSSTKIKIGCKKHGYFFMVPDNHLQGQGCAECRKLVLRKKFAQTKEDFVIKARKIHGDKYDYSRSYYINVNTKVEIICPEHGSFWQEPIGHYYQKNGCPGCKTSKGEKAIKNILCSNNINFIEQYAFKNCINPITNRKLPFDFFLPNHNICIEFDGEQHYQPIKHFGGEIKFNELVIRDLIKDQYCSQNNIKLVRVNHLGQIKIII